MTREQAKQAILTALKDCHVPQRSHFILPKVEKRPRNPGEFYPLEARQKGEQAVLNMSSLEDSLGNLRFLHVRQAFPLKPDAELIDVATHLAQSFVFAPASLNGSPVAYWTQIPVWFILTDVGGPTGSLLNQDRWLALLDKANTGDVPSIELSGYVVELVGHEAGLTEPEALSLLVDSALDGADYARMQLYRDLTACSSGSLVDAWVSADAQAGSAEAELTLAQTLYTKMLSSGSDAGQTAKISELLHRVADSPDKFYQLWAAGVLATEPGLRDPAVALKVATALNAQPDAGHERDPDYAELLAAARAANGQFASAVNSELTAIEWARHRGWNLKSMQSRLATYRAQRPWFGHLCDCQQIAPDSDVGL